VAEFLGYAGRKFNVRVSSICKGPPPGLVYPNGGKGFVGPKEKTIVGLSSYSILSDWKFATSKDDIQILPVNFAEKIAK
jgi:hypothetical protein